MRVSRSSSNRSAARTTSLADRYRPEAISSSINALKCSSRLNEDVLSHAGRIPTIGTCITSH